MKTILHKDQSGVAAVEFALILPVLVILFFGAVEVSNLLIADARLRNGVGAIADLLTQKTNGEVEISDMQVANVAGRTIMDPLPTGSSRLGFLLVLHRPLTTTTSRVVWTRIINSGSLTPTQTSMPALGLATPACSADTLPVALLPKTDTAPKNDVLRVTGAYEWQPWFSVIFNASIVLSSTNFNMPRYSNELNPAADVTPPC